jgi:ferredoxin--NADP+ reductase
MSDPGNAASSASLHNPSEGVAGLPLMPEAAMHLVTPLAPVVGRVISTARCTASSKSAAFVRHVAIDVSGTPLEGRFLAGQSFGVLAPGVDANGKPHKVRLYSIASPSQGEDGQGKVLATTVKRTIDEHHETHRLFLGVASNYLCDLQVGDEVRVSGPNGKRFLLPTHVNAHDYVFVATGTGIAPFRGMVLELLARKTTSRIVLLMGSPYATDLLYHQELEALARTHGNFSYVTAVSRERQADGNGPLYVHERIRTHADLLSPLLRTDRALVYVCGIAGMELGVLKALVETLPTDAADQYVKVDPSLRGASEGWTRRMIHKQIAPTRRVLMEVYD